MADLNSPLGRLTVASQGRKVLNIPDETHQELIQPPPPTLEELQAARHIKQRLSSSARERIELLSELGRLSEDVEFENHVFSIRSLKDKEMKSIAQMLAITEPGVETYFLSRDQVLARSIYKIDGQPIEMILSNGSLEAVLDLLDAMDDGVVEYLHNCYLEMIKKNKHKFEIKTEQEMKEVVEDIKK